MSSGCQTAPAKAEPAAEAASPAASAGPIELPAGTRVSLRLLATLEAGQAREGAPVVLMVAEDVRGPDGRVAIRQGALARGEVVWSRSEGTLSGLLGEPARLHVRLDKVLAVDGSELALAADPADPDKPYEFTRANTRPAPQPARLESALQDEEVRKLAEQLAMAYAGERDTEFLRDESSRAALNRLAEKLSLDETRRLLGAGGQPANRIVGTLDLVRRGDIRALAAGDAALGLAAVGELANVAGQVGSRFSRMLRGRTIRAFAGTEVEAFLAESAQVRATSR
ncbi:MAG: hypothetical protein SNJ74_05390 [Fimbriimonadaceae bacterium]